MILRSTIMVFLVGVAMTGCGKRKAPLPVFTIPPPHFHFCTNCNTFTVDDGQGRTNTLTPIVFTDCVHQWEALLPKSYCIKMRGKENQFAAGAVSNFEEKAWAMRPPLK
jgi:hypothetical protein